MSQIRTLDAPTLPIHVDDKWRREQQSFHRLLPQLLRSHLGQYVAIHEGNVVESGADKLEVAARAYARCGYVPIFVSLVSDCVPRAVRVPSPRVLPLERPV